MDAGLPDSVRYIKNGERGRWWKVARSSGQIHAGWSQVPRDLLKTADLEGVKPHVYAGWKGKREADATQDYNALVTLLDRPSQHVWVTFEAGYMWWCTVLDQVEALEEPETNEHGHLWLTCKTPWSNRSINGKRLLVMSELPGTVTTVAGYRRTLCEPAAARTILRIIREEEDEDASAAIQARIAYEQAVGKMVSRLSAKDFEVLVDLILSRSGWARLAKLGGVTEGVDIEVENSAAAEIAFVQVKSTATQATLNDYVERFQNRRDRYQRMILTVHSPSGNLVPPSDKPVQVWSGEYIAQLVVKHGLGDWVAKRL